MTPENFVYWLQGFVEMNGRENPTPEQWNSIRDHLKTVFIKVTPPLLVPIPPPTRYYESPITLPHPTPPYEIIC